MKVKSGISDWKEDMAHLKNQLKREQVGCVTGVDGVQLAKDNRKLKRLNARASSSETGH